MSERLESGLILPSGGVMLAPEAALEQLQAQRDRLQARVGELQQALTGALAEIELLRRRLGETPFLPLPNRAARRRAERQASRGAHP